MSQYPANATPFTFAARATGAWRITAMAAQAGEALAPAAALDVRAGLGSVESREGWTLRGVASHLRYTTVAEAGALASRQAALGRTDAVRAALIPIRKSPAWWALAQDERRTIYEERSRHTTIGLEYLPEIARRLHHSRDLGEPFDFLTWFEFAPEHESRFDDLLCRLRATEEWTYVDREIDIRLDRV